jgi:hypothetical protein
MREGGWRLLVQRHQERVRQALKLAVSMAT